ncbi:universal stress protein [Pelagibacterium lentulum]|uniref:Universal stress protein UspA n=1 Tax=Pelagibacterium lentulum TaxID=2029865 RepID=A0A916R948_9HYPH|nr:universal stress protein [Pelagibacterium lentulum]GGA44063.1 universal stress protein UspA [Pelagibacterium lentulum]
MYKNILVTVDLAHLDEETKAVQTVVEYAKAFGARLHVLTVVPDFGMSIVGGFFPADHEKTAVAKANEDLHAFTARVIPPEIRHRHIVDHGVIYKIILHYARETECDLIVMSSGRPDLEEYLLGPNAARVVRHARCSVLVVRT